MQSTDYKGFRLKKFLIRNEIGVEQAAELLAVSRQTVYQYFKSNELSRSVVNNILTAFNVTEGEVFGDTVNKTNTNMKQDALMQELLKTQRELIESYKEIADLKQRLGIYEKPSGKEQRNAG